MSSTQAEPAQSASAQTASQTASQTAAPITLVVKRTFSAPRERVFLAWTDVSELTDWFAPSEDYSTVASLDLRVGGAYRIEMHNKDGKVSIVVGTYREIDPPKKLSFSWRWEDKDAPETLVSVEFVAAGHSTEVILTHQRFTDQVSRDHHAQGWNGCFDKFSRYLSEN